MTVPASASPGDVFAPERQQHIALLVEEHGRVRVAPLSAQFGVSTVTIRKDLLALERIGRLVRTHGGAIAVGRVQPEHSFDSRERLQPVEKTGIGTAGAALVADGDSIALDASTTALYLARQLKVRGRWNQLTVITNGLRIATELAGFPGITVAMPGGRVRSEALSLVGPLGDAMFDRVNIQKAFVGAAGFAVETGLSDATEEEAHIKRAMVTAARVVIAIVDHTKWERAAFATFCPTSEIQTVLTDGGAPHDMVRALRDRGVEVQLVPTHEVAEPVVTDGSGAERSSP